MNYEYYNSLALNMTVLLVVVGFMIGLLVVTMGGGGGLLYVAILTSVFHVPVELAVATSLATIVPTTFVGAYSHWRSGNIRIKVGSFMLLGGISCAVLGTYLSTILPTWIYARLFGVVLLYMSLKIFLTKRKVRKNVQSSDNPVLPILNDDLSTKQIVVAVIYGGFGGLLSGFIGVSGVFPILAGLALLECNCLEIIGTSVFVVLGIAIVGFIAHLQIGHVDWNLVFNLTAGTVMGAYFGPSLLKRVNQQKIDIICKNILISLSIGMGLTLLIQGK